MWPRSWVGPVHGSSSRTHAVSVPHASCPTRSCGAGSRSHAAATSSAWPMLSGCSARSSAASTGAATHPAWRPRCGPNGSAGLVSYAGYDVIDVARQRDPAEPSLERVFWYQHLFKTERGRACLARHRHDLCRLLWAEWSPGWKFDDARYERSAAAFENPDFVDVVIHCYRFGFGLEPGDPALQPHEDLLAQQHPAIRLPAVTLDGTRDPLKLPAGLHIIPACSSGRSRASHRRYGPQPAAGSAPGVCGGHIQGA